MKLAENLLRARNLKSFAQKHEGRLDIAALKQEVNRLARCDLKKASRLAHSIEQLSQISRNPAMRAYARASRAMVLAYEGDHREANRLYRSSVKSLKAAGLKKEAAVIEKEQLRCLVLLGRYREALQTAQSARRALSKTDELELAQLETNIGAIYYRLDRYPTALRHYDRARAIFSRAGDDAMRAVVAFGRANILVEMDRPDEALALLGEAAKIFRRTRRHLLAGQSEFHIAYIRFLQGNYNAALALFYKVRDRLSELGSRDLVAWCDLDIAEIMLSLNAFENAAEKASTAHSIFRQLGMSYDAAKSLLARGLALMGLGQTTESRKCLILARKVFAASRNSTFVALTDSYLAELSLISGAKAESLSRASSSLRIFSRQKLAMRSAYARLLAARAAYEMGRGAQALRGAKRALRSLDGLYAPNIAYRCHHLIGCALRDEGRADEARREFLQAIYEIEKMRSGIAADELKTYLLRGKVVVYEDAIRSCLDEGSDESFDEAFRLVESSKSQALAELLARYINDLPSRRRGESMARKRLLKLIEEINWLGSQAKKGDESGRRGAQLSAASRRKIARCEREVTELFQRLEAENSDFTRLHSRHSTNAVDLIDALEEGETAIEYFATGNELSAFVVSRAGVETARNFASLGGVEDLLAALRFQMEKFAYGRAYVEKHSEHLRQGTDDILTRIYEAVFEPLEMMIETDRIIIIPHGPLHYVPFHALSDGLEYLVDQFEISRAPSAAVLKLCREAARRSPSKRGKTMLALGVSTPDLPHVEDEIKGLCEIFADAVTLTGGEATRKNLLSLAPSARYLHIASHGRFRQDNPMFSSLKLADSHLNFYGLLDLRLRAEMVTLSACQTGVSAIFPGDELHGLMRGFLYAGAPSLVVSLWMVSDRSTALLMTEMYKRISAGETKRAALRAAQLEVRELYPHPYYWAPFVLMGNPN